ncbi:helix-turn-helix transcriptional regulator [Listeria fleischmannii]|uniref:DeoR family transcriptional regulator n=1 Tax=Listeria fleischmannii FSL S10-1203 TaxID=1265822 RepID=W7E1S1_9LIST|nr:YafY family protein [Listeria fleischmannii]EUJ63936.1 DeoR family transcriptional regulator [Listeria fleischmannii FSL S10-1203]
MKIERLIGIFMLLLQRELVSANEMALMFEVSKRTIYRDMETLSMAKIPIYTMPGVNGGIGIMPTYKVDKRLLTTEDLTTIVTSLSGFEQLFSSQEIKKTLLKMQNMLKSNQENTDYLISLDFSNVTGKKEINEHVEELHLAIKKHQFVRISYNDRDGNETNRMVEPYHLLFRNRYWYLQGYSVEREDFRTFKLSRILHLDVLPETFIPREFVVKPFNPPKQYPAFEMLEVDLLLDRTGREQIIERANVIDIKPEDESYFLAKVILPNHEAGYRFLLNLGKHATIKSQNEFYDGFVAYLEDIQMKYQ